MKLEECFKCGIEISLVDSAYNEGLCRECYLLNYEENENVPYLICHTSRNPFFTKNKTYNIIEENNFCFMIYADNGEIHKLTKNNDYEGICYLNYMNKQ